MIDGLTAASVTFEMLTTVCGRPVRIFSDDYLSNASHIQDRIHDLKPPKIKFMKFLKLHFVYYKSLFKKSDFIFTIEFCLLVSLIFFVCTGVILL